MRYDFDQVNRENAEIAPNGCKVLRIDVTPYSNKPTCEVKIWTPKALKPKAHIAFAMTNAKARREEYIAKFLTDFDEHQARKAADRKARTQGDVTKANPGTIFYTSWGYEQTNVEFYQVIARVKSLITVREIAQEVESITGPMSERVKPVADKFIGEPETYRLMFGAGTPYFLHGKGMSKHHASPITPGRAYHQSHYA